MSNHKATAQHFREKCDETVSVLPAYCISYIRSIRQRTAPRTQYEYVKDIRMFLQWIEKSIGHMPDLNDLAQLTRQDFEDYMEHLEYYRDEHGRVHTNGRSSLARKLSSLSRFFNYLFQNDMLPRDETRKIQAPKVPKKNIIRLEKDETADLLHAVSGNAPMTPKQADYHAKQQLRDTAIIQLMLATGIRVSECAGIDLNDIDLNHHCIRIIRKGGDEATVYMSDDAQEALEAWLDHRASLPCPDTETAVFLSSRNTRMSVRAIEYMVRKYASRAVPAKHITPHKFRGTYATELYRATGDIYLVAETLGHKDITTTREHYASMTDDRKQAHRNTVDYKKEE